MIELVGVQWTDGGTVRLQRVGFQARRGEILGLVGGSGAGKSSVLRVVAGLCLPERGRIAVEGKDASRKPERLKAVAGLVTDEPSGPPELTVGEWRRFWAELDGVPASDRKARLDDVAQRFPLPADRRVDRLSLGERRRLELGRLLVRRPPLFLLDAPELGLDGVGLAALVETLRGVAAEGRTVILASATPQLPALLCDRVVLMSDGQTAGEVGRLEPGFASRIAVAQGWAS